MAILFGLILIMLRHPSLKYVPAFPITSFFAAGAIIVSIMKWTGQDLRQLYMDNQVWYRWQIWRAVTSVFPHVNLFHLAFNLYWVWTFGTLVERIYGHFRCLLIYLLLAMGSMLAEFAVLDGGIGLSGLGYGLWGMLMMLERHDPRFADVVDRQTNQTFAVWFVLCIVLTVTNIMPVANIAHGVGALMGMLLGLAICGRGNAKYVCSLALAAVFSLSVLGATVFWPWTNISGYAPEEIEQAGIIAKEQDKNTNRAIQLLTIAAHKPHASARYWHNLGVAYLQANRFEDARVAFNHAAQMPDASGEDQQTVDSINQVFPTGPTNR